MAETGKKASPKKAATKPVVKPVVAAKPVAAAKSAKPAASAKPAVSAAKPVAKKPAAVKKPAVAKKTAAKTTTKVIVLSDEQRYRMVAEAAYYRAESNQFKSDPLRDWIDAESDIDKLLSGGK